MSVATSIESLKRVVLSGSSPDQVWWSHLRNALNQHDVSVVWLTNEPGSSYTATNEVPANLVRVDRVDAHYRAVAAERARQAPIHWMEAAREPTPAPAMLTSGHMRLHDDLRGAEALWAGKCDDVWDRLDQPELADALERLVRILEGRSVGLALAGGGILGCCHMALIDGSKRSATCVALTELTVGVLQAAQVRQLMSENSARGLAFRRLLITTLALQLSGANRRIAHLTAASDDKALSPKDLDIR